MEGLFIGIAIILFIFRMMNKIKKTASGGNKSAGVQKTSPVKDKLQELISKMEEAERLKKEGNIPEKDENYFYSEKNSDGDDLDHEQIFSMQSEFSNASSESDFSDNHKYEEHTYMRESSVKSDIEDDAEDKDAHWKENDETSEKGAEQEKNIYTSVAKKERNISGSHISGKTANRASDKKSILSSLSKYSELQKAVVFKEILDLPVSEKY